VLALAGRFDAFAARVAAWLDEVFLVRRLMDEVTCYPQPEG
jgi:hypothetical protein